MELEKMVNDTQHFTQRVHELFGPQVFGDATTLVAELCRVVGILSESILVTEKKRPSRPATSVRLAHDIADIQYMVIAISELYHIDLAQAWNDLLQEGWGNIAKIENKEVDIKIE